VALLLKNLLFTVVVPGTVAGYLPPWIAGDRATASATSALLAAPLFAAGIAIYAWCVWDFARFGRGTPAPLDAPKRLVVRGLYRWVRNPMYVGVLCVIAGWAIRLRSPVLVVYLLAVAASFHAFVRLYEERHLRAVFGEEYAAYCARVHRWLPRPPA
jgi:protein-S-isoprenylcysteine O-methyltransferase Ste14